TATEERRRKLDEYVKLNACSLLLNVLREEAARTESALGDILDEDRTSGISLALFSELWPATDEYENLLDMPEYREADARSLALATALLLHAADSAEYLRYRAREYALMVEEEIAKVRAGGQS
ncbi:MAG: hypothetical protein ACRDNC_14750, partial [Gaiellaceae bacterium]